MNKPQHAVAGTLVRQSTCSTNVEPTLPKRKQLLQTGFTLLEMLLVLFLIGLMASATLMLTEGVEDQAKYDATKQRMEMMRKAIVGDPTRTVNGGPEISGFVADMGRLPECVAELLRSRNCADDDDLSLWSIDADTGLAFGWRGPYIQVLPERNGDLRFRDGYGNSASSDVSDAQNSGWKWALVDSVDVSNATVHVQSAGITPLFTEGDEYPLGDIANIEPLVYQRDHLVNIDNFTARVIFLNDSSTAITSIGSNGTDIKLKIHYPDGTDTATSLESEPFSLFVDASNAIPAFGTRHSAQIQFNGGEHIPLGVRTVEVICSDGRVFRGTSCDNTHNSFINISFLPNTQSSEFNFIWIIQ